MREIVGCVDRNLKITFLNYDNIKKMSNDSSLYGDKYILLFKLLKLLFYNNNNKNYIPLDLLEMFDKTPLYINCKNIFGYLTENENLKSITSSKLIFIPIKVIENFFENCCAKLQDEKKFVKSENKINLYLSILTHIYFNLYSKLDLDEIKKDIKRETTTTTTTTTNNNKVLFYDFRNIPFILQNDTLNNKNTINYDYSSFYNYKTHEDTIIKLLFECNRVTSVERLQYHHLCLIGKYYDLGILHFIKQNKKHYIYKNHPLSDIFQKFI